MQELNYEASKAINGGVWKWVGRAVLAGLSFALGKDLEEEWEEAWNDPYGVD